MLRAYVSAVVVAAIGILIHSAAAREVDNLVRIGDTVDGKTIERLLVDDAPQPVLNDVRNVLFTARHNSGVDLFTLDRMVSPDLPGFGGSVWSGEVSVDSNNLEQIAVLIGDIGDGVVLVDGTRVNTVGRIGQTVKINNHGTVLYPSDIVRIDDRFILNDHGSYAHNRMVANEGLVVLVDDQFSPRLPGQLWGFNNHGNILRLTQRWNGSTQDTTLHLNEEVIASSGNRVDGQQIDEICEGDVNDFGDIAFLATLNRSSSCGFVNLLDGKLTDKNLFLDNRAIFTTGFLGPDGIAVNNLASIDLNNRRDIVFQAVLVDGSDALMISYGPSIDFDENESIDINDLDAMVKDIAIGGDDLKFDLGEDGAVDPSDLDRWLWNAGVENSVSRQPFVSGDANLDGVVDAKDLNVLALNWQRDDNPGWSRGDFYADGSINVLDLNEIGLMWPNSAGAAVPEPATNTTLLTVLVALSLSRRKG